MHFLIADIDEDSNRELQLALSEFGPCDIKRDITSVFRTFDENPGASRYEAFFLSLGTLESNAVETLKHMRKHYRGIYDTLRFIVLDESEEAISIMRICASHKLQFIEKPVDRKKLIRMMQDLRII